MGCSGFGSDGDENSSCFGEFSKLLKVFSQSTQHMLSIFLFEISKNWT